MSEEREYKEFLSVDDMIGLGFTVEKLLSADLLEKMQILPMEITWQSLVDATNRLIVKGDKLTLDVDHKEALLVFSEAFRSAFLGSRGKENGS